MSNFKDRMNAIKNDADKQYRNVNNFQANEVKEMQDIDARMTIVITNTNAAVAQCNLFAALADPTQARNTAAGVTVDVTESSYDRIVEELQGTKAWKFNYAKFEATTAAQFSNPITMRETTSGGQGHYRTYSFGHLKDPRNMTQVLLVDDNFVASVIGDTEWVFDLQPNEVLTIYLTKGAEHTANVGVRNEPAMKINALR